MLIPLGRVLLWYVSFHLLIGTLLFTHQTTLYGVSWLIFHWYGQVFPIDIDSMLLSSIFGLETLVHMIYRNHTDLYHGETVYLLNVWVEEQGGGSGGCTNSCLMLTLTGKLATSPFFTWSQSDISWEYNFFMEDIESCCFAVFFEIQQTKLWVIYPNLNSFTK